MKKASIVALLFFASHFLLAQLPYTVKQYSVAVEKDIPYGMVTGFAGEQVELVLDLYKPIGDGNCQRPLLVMAHGGGFIAGSRHDNDVVKICEEMAARGYVTASIEYRLGMHPLNYYEPYALCNDAINPVGISKCIYMADELEIGRAYYRALQDLKGAIRFLKGRHTLDSTDVHNVFLGGSSAGAIAALGATFIDVPEEKPYQSDGYPAAPVPDTDLSSCVPAPGDRSRPDLGPIEGELNLNGHNARVQGVASFMGALFDLLSPLAGPDTPAIYLYHRTDDLVVPVTDDPLFNLFPYCIESINLCQPLYTRPEIFGSYSIMLTWSVMGSDAPPLFNDILDYGPADGNDCLDNPPGHSIDNIPLRCENLSGFFAQIIEANSNTPTGNCASATQLREAEPKLTVFPNPVTGNEINIICEECPKTVTLRLFDKIGYEVANTKADIGYCKWRIGTLPVGSYFLQVTTPEWTTTKFICIKL